MYAIDPPLFLAAALKVTSFVVKASPRCYTLASPHVIPDSTDKGTVKSLLHPYDPGFGPYLQVIGEVEEEARLANEG